MRTILCAAMIVCLTAPVHAQAINLLGAGTSKVTTQEDVDAEAARNNAYQSAIKKLPEQKTNKNDPWGTVRGAAQTDQKQARPGTK
jgi:hypothetical protein